MVKKIKMKKIIHNPKHQYDCENCKFSWSCGFKCRCHLRDLPEAPPESLYASQKNYKI